MFFPLLSLVTLFAMASYQGFNRHNLFPWGHIFVNILPLCGKKCRVIYLVYSNLSDSSSGDPVDCQKSSRDFHVFPFSRANIIHVMSRAPTQNCVTHFMTFING